MNAQHPVQQQHLSDEQFAECLTARYPQPAVRTHLATCDRCREELGVFLSSMDDFSQAAMDWSRAKQAVPGLKTTTVRGSVPQPLQWALACVLVLAAAVPVALHGTHGHDMTAGTAGVEGEDSSAQIAQDNRLMQSVDLALGQSDPSPYQEYHLDAPKPRQRVE